MAVLSRCLRFEVAPDRGSLCLTELPVAVVFLLRSWRLKLVRGIFLTGLYW